MDRQQLLRLLATQATAKKYHRGQLIFSEGDDAGDGFCCILSGHVRIFQNQAEKNIPLAVLEAGQFFGEAALVLSRPRQASAVSDEEGTIILHMNQQAFANAARTSFQFIRILMNECIQRIERDIRLLARQEKPPRIVVDPSLAPTIKANRANNLLLPQAINHTRSVFVGPGKPLFSQGQRNDGICYLVEKGVIVASRSYAEEVQPLFSFETGDLFGYSRVVTTPFREFSAGVEKDSARVIAFDEELLNRILRLDQNLFFGVFKTLVTQLVILNDSLRLSAVQSMRALGSEKTEEEILQAMREHAEEAEKAAQEEQAREEARLAALKEAEAAEEARLQANLEAEQQKLINQWEKKKESESLEGTDQAEAENEAEKSEEAVLDSNPKTAVP